VCLTFSSSAFTFLIEMNSSFKSLFSIGRYHHSYYFFLSISSGQYQKYPTILILVLCLLRVTPLVCSSYSSFAPSSSFFSTELMTKIVSYLHIHLFSNVLHRRRRISPRRPMYLLIVGSHYCVMRFAYALHMRQQNLVPFPCLYLEFFELVIEVFRACYRSLL